ncbi:Oidioi.mRNA.OKI2018_I69.chr1.g1579.t1.cds [Oikopleura dioica]|uniref:Oidioi.mRNA.OKI2018_I69.chr1.g1579.t1.cds n=1 Tax=Oikopleura dioica TaxID=34765 RepID=A0ABN7SRV9_OIKDI|nr:Oidioi.mRNA.OKI2018_I69.chr1.g1579.t1.cds [Oikopleura dioica]
MTWNRGNSYSDRKSGGNSRRRNGFRNRIPLEKRKIKTDFDEKAFPGLKDLTQKERNNFFTLYERHDQEYDQPFTFKKKEKATRHEISNVRTTKRAISPVHQNFKSKRPRSSTRPDEPTRSGPIYNDSTTDEEDPYGFKENYSNPTKIRLEAENQRRINWVLSLSDEEFHWLRKQQGIHGDTQEKAAQAEVERKSIQTQYRKEDFKSVNPYDSFSSRARISTNSSHSIDARLEELQSSMSKRSHDF